MSMFGAIPCGVVEPMLEGSSHSHFPSNVSEYALLRPLGKGSFGDVYEAVLLKDAKGESRFAVKMIDKKKISGISGMIERVRNEVGIHHQLRHPNILRLYHFFEDGKRVYLVMELCRHGELYQFLKSRHPGGLPEAETRTIFREIVQAVAYLHEHGIIHRDLKLSNILLDDSMKPKLADFGLAVRQSNPLSSEQQTLCGTPNYLAPEILRKRPYGAAADQWSLGCILFSLLTGRPPFESAEVRGTFERASRVQYSLPSRLSEEAKDLISRLIVFDPDARLSASSVLNHPFLRSEPKQPFQPILTARLKPIRQPTKHGIFQLLESGHVWIDFMIDPTLTVISPDGLKVSCYAKGVSSEQFSTTRPLETYDYLHLPPSKLKIYEYARRFIGLLRSKTPRIAICSGRFRAFLMDNGPPADFCIRYHAGTESGWRLEYSATQRSLRIFDPAGVCKNTILNPDNSSLGKPELTASTRLMLAEYLARCEQAITTAKRIRDDQDAGRLPFPFVVREQVQSHQTSTESLVPVTTIPMLTLGTGINASLQTQIVPMQSKLSISPPPFAIAYRTFLPQVGWCLASTDDQYLLLFSDGASILLDGRSNAVGYQDSTRPLTWYHIDEALPKFAKNRLTFFPQFVQLLKQVSS